MKHRRLKHLRVASPCPAAWSDMVGDDKVRFCNTCCLNVYNVSAMTADEAEELLSKASGRLCVRYYRRADGRVLTQDCPVGLARVRQKLAGKLSLAAAFALGVLLYPFKPHRAATPERAPIYYEPKPEPVVQGKVLMGAIAPAQHLGRIAPAIPTWEHEGPE